MKSIATLTMNPALDTAYDVDRVFHTHKVRSHGERYEPGGGGINVSRVISRLGGTARAYYLAGGATGAALDALLDLHQIVRTRIAIKDHTRVSSAIYERESGKEYRFVPRGPTVSEAEWRACVAAIGTIDCDYLVLSGSLPDGVPEDFYSRVQAIAAQRGTKLILDSSGAALRSGLANGGLYLVKPSLGELQDAVGHPLESPAEIAKAAAAIVERGLAKHVAVTMGHDGALLASSAGVVRLPAIAVDAKSAVGAGDSFVAAMVFAIACDRPVLDAFRYGIAAGAAAVLTPGTDLCHPVDIDRLYAAAAIASSDLGARS
ncbi:MAG: 1-phosphofructokinase family hexose kinase [Sphingopyxis sp.]|nr:1-phosphofructokinase family hexose kinase [Sphingopyxis sp.]